MRTLTVQIVVSFTVVHVLNAAHQFEPCGFINEFMNNYNKFQGRIFITRE